MRGNTTETHAALMAPLFDYAPERVVLAEGGSYQKTTTYRYDDRRRLIQMSESHSLPETPRVVRTLYYGRGERLEKILTETFWSADPSNWTTELRRYDNSGRLVTKVIHSEERWGSRSVEDYPVRIEPDGDGRPIRMQLEGETLAAFQYDTATGRVRSVTDEVSRKLRELTFDDVGRLTEQAVRAIADPNADPVRSGFVYDDPRGFVSHACMGGNVVGACTAATSDTAFELMTTSDGEPIELVRSSTVSSIEQRDVVRYTTAGTSLGLQQLVEGWPVADFVLGIYGRGEIELGDLVEH